MEICEAKLILNLTLGKKSQFCLEEMPSKEEKVLKV
jgi:hypothetical protein